MKIQANLGGQDRVIELPDGSTPDQIDEVLSHASQQFSAPQQSQVIDNNQKGFGERLGEAYQKNLGEMQGIADQAASGDISKLEASGRMGLKYAQIAPQAVSEGAVSAFRALPDAIKQPIPPLAILKKGAENVYTAVADSPVGDVARSAVNSYKGFEKEHPVAAGRIGSVVDAGNLLASLLPIEGTSALSAAGEAADPLIKGSGKALTASGDALYKSGQAAFDAKRASFIQDLISPKLTPTVRADQFSRSTEKGLLRKATVEPSPQDAEIISTISNLPVSKGKSMLANYNIISQANEKEANGLILKLKSNDVPVGLDDVQLSIDNAFNKLKQNPYVTGNGELAANKVVDVMNKAILDNADQNGIIKTSNLLQARKDFDRMIKDQKGGKIFDPSLDSPASIAIQGMRQSINDLIESKVQNLGFKDSLRKQSNLYRAMENIETKGGYQPKNAISRFAQKASNIIPVKNTIAKGALALGATGALATAPALTAGVLGGYGAYRVASSPLLRKGIGTTLSKSGKGLQRLAP